MLHIRSAIGQHAVCLAECNPKIAIQPNFVLKYSLIFRSCGTKQSLGGVSLRGMQRGRHDSNRSPSLLHSSLAKLQPQRDNSLILDDPVLTKAVPLPEMAPAMQTRLR
jgi:hypothetical protein